MSQGEWLVLTTANHFLDDVKDLCELQGWYYAHKSKNSVKLDLLLAIQAWEKWRNSETLLPVASIKNIYSYLGDNVTTKKVITFKSVWMITDYKQMTFGSKRLQG
jgi:hypothetical protein